MNNTLAIVCFSELATKVMIELLGTYTEDNASQARDDAQRYTEQLFEENMSAGI